MSHRIDLIISGVTRIIDGVCIVASLGSYMPDLTLQYTRHATKRKFERQCILSYNPWDGTLLAEKQHRRAFPGVWNYNPYTGAKRDDNDIEIDPNGFYCYAE